MIAKTLTFVRVSPLFGALQEVSENDPAARLARKMVLQIMPRRHRPNGHEDAHTATHQEPRDGKQHHKTQNARHDIDPKRGEPAFVEVEMNGHPDH